jgi:hypothetical protein
MLLVLNVSYLFASSVSGWPCLHLGCSNRRDTSEARQPQPWLPHWYCLPSCLECPSKSPREVVPSSALLQDDNVTSSMYTSSFNHKTLVEATWQVKNVDTCCGYAAARMIVLWRHGGMMNSSPGIKMTISDLGTYPFFSTWKSQCPHIRSGIAIGGCSLYNSCI